MPFLMGFLATIDLREIGIFFVSLGLGFIVFLLSDKSSYITGSEHFIDGGWNAA